MSAPIINNAVVDSITADGPPAPGLGSESAPYTVHLGGNPLPNGEAGPIEVRLTRAQLRKLADLAVGALGHNWTHWASGQER